MTPLVAMEHENRPVPGLRVANFVLFQVVWFITVLGAARGATWPGVAALGLFSLAHARLVPAARPDFVLAGIAAAIGFVGDSILVGTGRLVVVTGWPFAGLASFWMILLWANLALAINHSLGWLHGRYALAALLGAAGGPLAYLGGTALGAGRFTGDTTGTLVALGLCWAVAMPLLFAIATRLNRRDPSPTRRVGGTPAKKQPRQGKAGL